MKKRDRIKRMSVASALGVLTIASSLVTTAPAFAGPCSDKSSGSSNTVMWTGSTYTCAYVAASGNKSIPPAATQSWTSSTGTGYKKAYTCHGQTGGVTVTYIYSDAGGTNVGSSITYTALGNASGGRHWNAAVLWATNNYLKGVDTFPASDQYIHNCSTDYSIAANLSYVTNIATAGGDQTIQAGNTVTYTVTVTSPDGGGTPEGNVILFQQAIANDPQNPKVNNQDPIVKDCSLNQIGGSDFAIAKAQLSNGMATLTTNGQSQTTPPWAPGDYYVYAVYSGSPLASNGAAAHCIAPPGGSGLTGAKQSTSSKVTVTAGVPNAPTNLSLTATNVSITASFTKSSNNGGSAITGYQLTCTNTSSTLSSAATGTTSPITLSGLMGGATYSCAVQAQNAVGFSLSSSARSVKTLPAVAADAPTNLSLTATNVSITASFTASSNNGGSPITGYKLTCTNTSSTLSSAATGTTSPIKLSGLTGGATYSCAVQAQNAGGSSLSSAASSVTTLPATVPDEPTVLSYTTTTTQINFVFKAPSNNGGATITGYRLTCTPTSSKVSTSVTGTTSPITLGGLVAGATYTCYLQAQNSVGFSSSQAINSIHLLP